MIERFIISIEKFKYAYSYHIILEQHTKVTTLQSRSTYEKDTLLLNKIIRNPKKVVEFFKHKHKLEHLQISLSYGAMLRKELKQDA